MLQLQKRFLLGLSNRNPPSRLDFDLTSVIQLGEAVLTVAVAATHSRSHRSVSVRGSWPGDVPLGKTLNPKLSQKAQTLLWGRDTFPAHKITIKSFCLSLDIPPHLDERTWILTERLEPSSSSVSLARGQSTTGNVFPASSVLQPELEPESTHGSKL